MLLERDTVSPNGDNSFSSIEALRRLSKDKEEQYRNLIYHGNLIAYQLNQVKEYIQHLNGLLAIEGLPTITLSELSGKPGVGKPGNRSKDMPPRKAEWAGMSLVGAVKIILAGENREFHADEIVQRIYETHTRAEKKKAKQSLVSTLRVGGKIRAGGKNAEWKTLPKNKYKSLEPKQGFLAGVQ